MGLWRLLALCTHGNEAGASRHPHCGKLLLTCCPVPDITFLSRECPRYLAPHPQLILCHPMLLQVLQYTLYPEAEVGEMVGEVSRALSWTLDNVGRFGGRPDMITLVGHSAGAQMALMALLHRALGKGGGGGSGGSNNSAGSGGGVSRSVDIPGGEFNDGRMPRQLVAMAGVYDIAAHFEYEKGERSRWCGVMLLPLAFMALSAAGLSLTPLCPLLHPHSHRLTRCWIPTHTARPLTARLGAGRDVHELSTMARAIGGPEQFGAQSPSVILRHALAKEKCRKGANSVPSDPTLWQQHWQALRGELIAQRIGFERAISGPTAVEAPLALAEPATLPIFSLTTADAAVLPPTIFMSSCTDVTVPW